MIEKLEWKSTFSFKSVFSLHFNKCRGSACLKTWNGNNAGSSNRTSLNDSVSPSFTPGQYEAFSHSASRRKNKLAASLLWRKTPWRLLWDKRENNTLACRVFLHSCIKSICTPRLLRKYFGIFGSYCRRIAYFLCPHVHREKFELHFCQVCLRRHVTHAHSVEVYLSEKALFPNHHFVDPYQNSTARTKGSRYRCCNGWEPQRLQHFVFWRPIPLQTKLNLLQQGSK